MTGWTCPHGVGEPLGRGDCERCNVELMGRPEPHAMTGEDRSAEVIALLNDANAYRVEDIHYRLEALVGRPVWTHEFATDLALAEEARTRQHPTDIEGHLRRTAEALTDAPIMVIKP